MFKKRAVWDEPEKIKTIDVINTSTIKVQTAIPGCAHDCDSFMIRKTVTLNTKHDDMRGIMTIYQCENIKECLHLMKQMKRNEEVTNDNSGSNSETE